MLGEHCVRAWPKLLAGAGIIATSVLLLLIAVPPDAPGSHCVTADKLKNLQWTGTGDAFRNFDFRSTDIDRCNVDWPVNFLFWNNAEINKIKQRFDSVGYDPRFDTNGMHMQMDDGPQGSGWDDDAGRKNGGCLVGDTEHYRVYALGSDDRNYSMDLGYYVYGTTHIDHAECTPGGWSGLSRTSEIRVAEDAVNAWEPSRVDMDAADFYNHQNPTQSGSHKIWNDGWATYVKVGAN